MEPIIVYLLLYYPGLFAMRIVCVLCYYYYQLFGGMNPDTILHMILSFDLSSADDRRRPTSR